MQWLTVLLATCSLAAASYGVYDQQPYDSEVTYAQRVFNAELNRPFNALLDSKAFKSGQEYVYDYVTIATTKVPHRSMEITGLEIRCQLRLQFPQQTTVLALCENPQVMAIAGSATFQDQKIPQDQKKPLPTQQNDDIVSCFAKPWGFEYSQGKVRDMKVASQLPAFCKNLIKGVSSLLEVTPQAPAGSQAATLEPAFTKQRLMETGLFRQESMPYKPVFYSVMEEGISGKCESIYGKGYVNKPSILSSPYGSSMGKSVLYKIRNYKNCESESTWEEGYLTSLTTSGQGFETRDVVERYSHTDYVMTGSEQSPSFGLESVHLRAKFLVKPFTEQQGIISTAVQQDLTLRGVQSISRAMEQPVTSLQHPLRLEIPNYMPIVKPNELYVIGLPQDSYQRGQSPSPSQVSQVVDQLIEEMSPTRAVLDQDKIVKLHKDIMTYMKYMPTADIKTMMSEVINAQPEQSQYKKKQFLLDTLSATPTPDALFAVVDLLGRPQVVPLNQTASILRSIATIVIPDKRIVEFVQPGGQPLVPSCQSDPAVEKTILLTTGLLQHRILHHLNNSAMAKHQIHSQFLEPIAQKWCDKLHQTQSIESKIWMLKAIGNSGMPQHLPCLYQILQQSVGPQMTEVRVEAMRATRRMPDPSKKAIVQMLMKQYLDQRLDTATRATAFLTIIDHQPCNNTIQVMIHAHRNETNAQVGCLVYSTLQTLSQARYPAIMHFSYQLKKIMPLVKPFRCNSQQSFMSHFESYFRSLDQAVGLDYIHIKSPEASLSSIHVLKSYVTNMGKSINLVEVSARDSSQIIKRLVDKLWGPSSCLLDHISSGSWDKLSQFLLDPISRTQGSFEFDLDELMNQMSITERETLSDPRIRLSLKVLGQDQLTGEWNKNQLLRLLQTSLPSQNSNRYIWKTLRSLNFGRSSQMYPTPMGVFFSLNHTMFATASVDATSTYTLPSFTDIVRSVFGYGQQVKASYNTQMMVSQVTYLERTAGISLPVINAFIKQNLTMSSVLPIKINADIDTEQKVRINFQWQLPQHLENILRIKYESSINVKKTGLQACGGQSPSIYIAKRPLSMPQINKPLIITANMPMPKINSELKFICKLPNAKPSWDSSPNYWSNAEMRLSIRPIGSGYDSYGQSYDSFSLDQQNYDQQQNYGQRISQNYEGSSIFIQTEFSRTTRQASQGLDIPQMDSINYRISSRQDPYSQQQQEADVPLDPSLGQATVYKMKTAISSGSPQGQQVSQCIKYVAVSQEQPAYQVGCSARASDQQHYGVHIMGNLQKLLQPISLRSADDVVAKMVAVFGQSKIRAIVKPGTQQVTFDRFKGNYIYDFLSRNLGVDIRVDDLSQSFQQQQAQPGQMNFKVDMDYTGVSPNTTSVVRMLADYATVAYTNALWKVDPAFNMQGVDPSYSMQGQSQGKIMALITYTPMWNQAAVMVNTPWGKRYSLEMPFYLPTVNCGYWCQTSLIKPVNVSTSALDIINGRSSMRLGGLQPHSLIFRDFQMETCTVRPSTDHFTVTTYDQRTVRTPALTPNCEVVLTSDCGKNKLFTISALKTSSNMMTFRMMLRVPHPHMLELRPTTTGYSGTTMTVFWDGHQMATLTDNTKVPLIADGENVGFVMMEGQMIKTFVRKLWVEMDITPAQFGQIKVSHMYTSMCGACGNMNGLMSDDLEGPQAQQFLSDEEFVHSYILPGGQCPREQVLSQWGIIPSEARCQTVQRVYMQRKQIGDSVKQCFSQELHQLCPDNCPRVQASQTIRVNMVCLPDSSQEIVIIKQAIRNDIQRYLRLITTKPISYVEEITLPATCSKGL